MPTVNLTAIGSLSESKRYALGGIHSRTVLRWAREGYIPAYPIGEGQRRLWRFLRADLETWMQSRQTGTLPPAIGAPVERQHD